MGSTRRLIGLPLALVAFLAIPGAAAAQTSACTPTSIFFDWNSTRVSEESQAALERLAVAIAWKGPDLAHILLIAHTDTTGSPDANRLMARRRAQAVRDVLVAYNVPRALITMRSAGSLAPRVATGRNVREPRNRRVELFVQMSADAQARQLQDGRPIC